MLYNQYMTDQLRYDYATLKATITEDGYLIDTPVIARVGIQEYRRGDGSVRRELRLPEEVFAQASLDSFRGKPITDDHPPEAVTAKNFKKYAVGVISGAAHQDGDNLRAGIIIHDGNSVDKATKGGKKELSVGYTVTLDETPGIWNDQAYDAVQKNIRVNHLSLVQRGRAGNARLNLDRHDAVSITNEDVTMTTDNLGRLRLDSGLEYPAAQEVVLAFEKLHKDNDMSVAKVKQLTTVIDTLSAEKDMLEAKIESADKIKADALELARKEVKDRADLEKVAESFKVDCAGKTDREVKELVIKTVRADADLSAKSDEYIAASFDIAVELKKDAAIESQRKTVAKSDSAATVKSGSYKDFMTQLSKGTK